MYIYFNANVHTFVGQSAINQHWAKGRPPELQIIYIPVHIYVAGIFCFKLCTCFCGFSPGLELCSRLFLQLSFNNESTGIIRDSRY